MFIIRDLRQAGRHLYDPNHHLQNSYKMTQFLDLPLEILPVIFENILKPHHITTICLVNKTFHEFAIPRLYDRASIYSWQREGKTKVITHLHVPPE